MATLNRIIQRSCVKITPDFFQYNHQITSTKLIMSDNIQPATSITATIDCGKSSASDGI